MNQRHAWRCWDVSLPDRHYRRSFRRRRAADRCIRRLFAEGHPMVLLTHWECRNRIGGTFFVGRLFLIGEWECRPG
jgi:hypothetical protein